MTRSSEWAVEAHGLVKVFGDNRAVDGVDLTVRAGAVYGVLGPNGAGKTTTISMLATLLKPDAGEAFIFGRDIRREQQVVRQLIGVTAQFNDPFFDLTGWSAALDGVPYGTANGALSGRRAAKTFTVNHSKAAATDLTVSAAIGSGSGGALVKAGNGTMDLAGINSYSGGTTVSAGTLLVSGSITGATRASALAAGVNPRIS